VSASKIVSGLRKDDEISPYLVYLGSLKIDFVQVYIIYQTRFTQSG